ncbi:MAG: acyl-CoA dehydrogenase family protein [Burkholderiales bacterium]|nr:acyl-CoA dehydrogenase family protein [Burkholderiales bacterium]
MSNFALSSNQEMLAESARRYFERGYGSAVRAASIAHAHGCAPARWTEIAEMGWLAMPLPETDGGLGASLADMCVLAEEMGRGLLVEPWLASGVLAATLLSRAGTEAQRAAWLPALAAGSKRIAFAAWEPDSRFDATQVDTCAQAYSGGYRLDGAKELAQGAAGADAIIVCARLMTEDPGTQHALFLVDAGTPGLAVQGYALIDGRSAAHVTLHEAMVPGAARLSATVDIAAEIAHALDIALIVQCAETAGAMARGLEITLEYLKTRKQFGRVLAANQVLQHRLVDLYVAVEETRALVRAAALLAGESAAQRRYYAAATKAFASQAARTTWEEVVQLHGAIGMTDEYVIGAYARHLAASHALFGDYEAQLERMAAGE